MYVAVKSSFFSVFFSSSCFLVSIHTSHMYGAENRLKVQMNIDERRIEMKKIPSHEIYS